MIADCWHTQLRLVARYFPAMQLRAHRTTESMFAFGGENVFIYITPTVEPRNIKCPPNVVKAATERGYIIIHVQEPRE